MKCCFWFSDRGHPIGCVGTYFVQILWGRTKLGGKSVWNVTVWRTLSPLNEIIIVTINLLCVVIFSPDLKVDRDITLKMYYDSKNQFLKRTHVLFLFWCLEEILQVMVLHASIKNGSENSDELQKYALKMLGDSYYFRESESILTHSNHAKTSHFSGRGSLLFQFFEFSTRFLMLLLHFRNFQNTF